jgi:RNA polymerase sigma factor (sigma-70 family)
MCYHKPDHATEFEKYKCAQSGCAACLEKLLAEHQGLVLAVLKRQWLGGMAYADLVQEGQIALWQAVLGYEPERGYAFSTYAWRAIERRIWAVVGRWQRGGGSVEVVAAGDPLTIAERELEASQRQRGVAAVVQQLPERLEAVISSVYGLDGRPARTLAALGRDWGLSRERVRQLHNEGLRQLRRPDRSGQLRLWWGSASRASYQYMQQQNRRCLRQRRGRSR